MNNKKQKRTSLKDLAKELNVSIATVSRALRSSSEIGEEMQRRVKDLAKKMNYRPNPFAQSLRKEAPKIIGVVVPNLETHYYAAVLDGIEDEARRAGYSVISANSHESFETEAQAIDNFISLHVEGIIACLAQETTDYCHFDELNQMGIPLVFFGRQRRKHGYLEALRENRIPIDRNLVACNTIDYQIALEETTKLLQSPNRPDAILAFNDIITFAAFTAIKQQGLRIPEDVSLIGFTDDAHAAYVTPRLSAIVDQSHLMGVTACQLLLKHIQGDAKVCKKIVPQQLVIRDTSAKNKI